MEPMAGSSRKFLLESWLELHDAIENHPQVRRLLFDPVTGLPTTPLLFPRIQRLLDERGEVSMMCLNVVRYSKIEEIYGWRVFDEVMRHVAEVLENITGTYLRESDVIAELMVSGNSFVIVLSPPRNHLHMDADDLEALARRVEVRVRQELERVLEPYLFQKFGCYMGSTIVRHEQNVRLERLIYDGLERALNESNSRELLDHQRRHNRLREIIHEEDIRTLVHPVVRFEDNEVIGYEALSRGPEGGEFERPDKLFKVAYDADLVFRLERLCRRKALEAARAMPPNRLLFLNIEPETVSDPELRDAVFTSLLTDVSLTPDRVVLEITERTAINDFHNFRSTLEYLRALGFSIAVDDAGAGYGSLHCLADVKPEWLKVDISLVRGCDGDECRRQLIGAMVTFARRMGSRLVAEGIETQEELTALRALGVEYGQGFLFAIPAEPFPEDPAAISA